MNWADVPLEHMSHRELCQWLVRTEYARATEERRVSGLAEWMAQPTAAVRAACNTARNIRQDRQERRRAARAARKKEENDRVQQQQRAEHT